MKHLFFAIAATATALAALMSCSSDKIDREALVTRNNPHVTEVNPLHSLNLGNGGFTVTLDATGLQTFPEFYKNGLSLGTYSQWGWHSFPNTEGYTEAETLENHPLPGHPEGVYAVQVGNGRPERNQQASEWIRANPHRLHLGNFGFAGMKPEEISAVDQTLDMWNGELLSSFCWNGKPVTVRTVCAGDSDLIAASISSSEPLPVALRFPFPSGVHTDDASDWNSDGRHTTEIVAEGRGVTVLKRTIDDSCYYVAVSAKGAELRRTGPNAFELVPSSGEWSFSAGFSEDCPEAAAVSFETARKSAVKMWNDWWKTTGVVDFSRCTADGAQMLESRVVRSQYLIRVQEAQDFPPSETGMTYNSWFGKFHLEMVMWHSFHYATWGKPELLEKQLAWYLTAMPKAAEIAARQGFDGVRWMKMTDPSGREAPSDIGSYIIWQQPHPIYMAELIYRADPDKAFLGKYYDMVQKTAAFMASFVNWDEENGRYVIEGACAANESYDEENTLNPAFELSYWHFGLTVAQKWRERMGEERNPEWDLILEKLSPLAASPDGIYLPAEKGPGIPDFEAMTVSVVDAAAAPAGGYSNGQRPKGTVVQVKARPGFDPFYIRATSSENLLAYGMLPACRLFTEENMQKTLVRASENWGWRSNNWSWNYPTFIMNATRLLQPELAVRAATMDGHTDAVLPSGNNYRSETLRMYLPGNGGLLMAVGMMCAGWDGCTVENPGFPKDGTWDVRWEGILPMP